MGSHAPCRAAWDVLLMELLFVIFVKGSFASGVEWVTIKWASNVFFSFFCSMTMTAKSSPKMLCGMLMQPLLQCGLNWEHYIFEVTHVAFISDCGLNEEHYVFEVTRCSHLWLWSDLGALCFWSDARCSHLWSCKELDAFKFTCMTCLSFQLTWANIVFKSFHTVFDLFTQDLNKHGCEIPLLHRRLRLGSKWMQAWLQIFKPCENRLGHKSK